MDKDKQDKKKSRVYMGYVYISNREAAIIKRMRQSEFGTYQIVKLDGQPVRIVEGGSSMIDDDEADDMFCDPITGDIKS